MKKLAKNTCLLYLVVAISALTITYFYTYYATMTCMAYFDGKDSDQLENSIDGLSTISFIILTVILILSGFMMLRRLRHRFHGLYTDYGKWLWIIVLS